jgi:hypothetical protein
VTRKGEIRVEQRPAYSISQRLAYDLSSFEKIDLAASGVQVAAMAVEMSPKQWNTVKLDHR